ncbi:CDP-glucose 4,6-dehydratase [Xanthobacter pseudotagetidis]|uniref:CDP-glucose 4,6-dehydratase n=1 Tax=Xanthobacter pseudotagetidis TaxID=3119911 RepID=UPI00372808EF
MGAFEGDLRGARILVTGHSGFTGGWASLWLSQIGAEVHGLSLPPETAPNLFAAAGVEAACVSSTFADIRDADAVRAVFERVRPDLVLHLAAQPLVRRSYRLPIETYATNLMGTVHVLEAARQQAQVKGAVCITTDKVYANRETDHAYGEGDRLGGHDPYSASKTCAEIAIESYRSSLPSWGQDMLIASARGGNIIGGGDWSEDRLVPDFARAAVQNEALVIRNPKAVRPWQHVLCLCHGYLTLLAQITRGNRAVSDAWNFGPDRADCVSVEEMLKRMAQHWSSLRVDVVPAIQHEAKLLMLDSAKARAALGWLPAWTLGETLAATAGWYRGYHDDPSAARAITLGQISAYRERIGSPALGAGASHA